MPEIKHNFIKGRMNKDLDERLVPNGEYRDALNIEVSTSEGSDVGSVQNLEGNLLVSSKDQNNNDFLSDDTDSTGINRNASTVGSYADQSTKTIFNFIHKASDLVEDGTYGGRVRFTGVRSDVISTYKPTSTNSGITYPLVTDVYETRIAPTVLQTGQSGIIEGVPGIAYRTVNGVTLYAPKGIVPGMKVKLLGPDGFNYWFNQTVVVKSIQLGYSESDTKIITTIPQSGSLYFDAVNRDAGLVFQFTSDRILNFQEGVKEIESNAEGTPSSITPKDTIITGINYVNDILFYTDNLTEPKRIVLDRFLNTDGSYDVHSNVQRHSLWRSTIEESDQENFAWLEEKYITTIRKNPRLAPTVVAKASDRPAGANIGNTSLSYSDATFSSIAITDGGFNSTFNFLLPNQSAVVESGQEYDVSAVLKTVNWRVGDVLVLTGNLSAATARVKIVAADTSQSTTVGNFTISLLDIDEGYFVAGEVVPPQESWQAVLSSNKKIHNTSFVYFAYRYKYFDGEYSAISPYSKPVFIPSFYSFNSITGFNVGMENQLRSMQVSDFVEKSIPADVAEIEILFRTSDSENLYAIETVKKDSTKWSESLSGGGNTGLIKIEDAVFGRTIESKQLVRSFDAVPTKAKAQEFSSSRLMYGNYTEGYDLINSDGQRVEADITSTLVNRDVSFTTSIPFLNIVDASYNNPGIFEFSHNSEESSETGDLSLVSLPTNNEFIDTTNAFNTAEALYTCNVAGEYSIDLLLESKVITGNYSGTNASSQNTLHELQLGVFKNGSIVGGFSEQSFSLSNNASFHSSEFSISKSQTISLAVGDEVNFRIKGSFLSLSQLITDFSLDIQNFVLNINGGETAVDVTTSAPRESVKSIRDYQVGVVYGDKYGRESEIIFDTEDTINATQQDSITANNIKCSIKNKFPYWAEYYKFFVKEIAAEYYNISLFKAYPNDGTLSDPDVSTVYYWLSFNSADRNKVEKDDYLLLKKKHGVNQAPLLADGTVEADARWRVLDIVDKAETADDGFEIKGVPITATDQDISGKFFVKIEADLNFDDYIGFDFSDSNVLNGAVFEVEKKQTQTLDLFYEASQAYPIRLDKVNAESYIKHGSKVAPIVGGDLNDLVNGGFKVVNVKGAEAIQGNYAYFNSNSSEDYFCIVTIANEAGQNVQDYFLELGLDFIQTNTVFSSGSYIRFEQEDGSYVTAQAVSMNTVDNTIKIIPYTHSTQQGFIGSNISVGETDICLPWYNCFAFGNGVESDRIRDDFNSKTIFPYTSVGKQSGFKASLPVVNYNKRENTSDIIFSQIFNESTQVAGYNEFIVAEDITKKLNSEYGSIQRLYTRQSNVLAFCENKVLKILADKDALFNADGEILRVSSTNVLGEAVPFSGDHGISNNPESLAVDEYRIYFTDKFRGSVCRLSQDGVTAISNIGMRDWFNDNLEPASAMIGSYDTNKNEYNLTIHSSTNPGYKKEVYTLTYSDSSIDGQRGGWVSFKSFIKESGLSMSNEYYTFKNGDMWLHHPEQESVLQNNFYGTQYTSTLDVLFNDFSGDVKLFKTLNYEGTQSKEI